MSRRTGVPSIAPVTFGLAGVIYLGGDRTEGVRDESWLMNSFRTVPQTSRIEWRSEDVRVISVQHANETHTTPGARTCRVPRTAELQSVVVGAFFGCRGSQFDPERFSQQVLDGYRMSGDAYFRGINGAWGGVLWNAGEQRAHFVRDASGLQALYVAPLRDRIVFSTDLRVFQANRILETPDDQAIAELLHYLYVPSPRTILKGCHAVLPGHVLTVGRSVEQKRYAAPRFVRGPSLDDSADVKQVIEEQLPIFEEKLLTAVADCIPATGRIALTLSGGKDSSTLAVALSKICPDRVLALTVGQKAEQLNEEDHAALVCQSLGLAHQCYLPTDEDLARGIYTFARQHDQPTGDPAALPYFLGMSSLPDDCTVIMDGSGNDYYFGLPHPVKGVWHYQRRLEAQKYVPDVLWPLVLRLMAAGPAELSRLSHYWSRPLEESWVAWEGWPSADLAELFGRDISFEDTYLWQKMRQGDTSDWLTLITDVVFGIWQPHTDFRKAIDFAHAAGKGIRLPFVDDRLAAFVNELPEPLKFSGSKNKMLLRAYMAKNLPREIVEKPKRGFIFDLNRILQNPVYPWVEELNQAGLLKVLPTWSQPSIDELLNRYRGAPADQRWQHRLYALCLLATVSAMKNGYVPALATREDS